MNILIVRLGALGDIVHTVPAAAALRRAYPAAQIDWLVEPRHRGIVDLVTAIDQPIVLEAPHALRGWRAAVARLRQRSYDLAIDFQGLLKSAVLARASGAARVVGFSIWHLREKTARPFYSHAYDAEGGHVIRKNLRLLEAIGIDASAIEFPLAQVTSPALASLRLLIGPETPFALINPGAAWPNKRWPAERFGELAQFLAETRGLTPVIIWGPGEETLAASVQSASGGRAVVAPPTTLADLVGVSRAASLVVSGDTGPLHIATAVGTPVVSIFGPTDPARNGPWRASDESVSRYDACHCHYDRRCHHTPWCLLDLQAPEVCAAAARRLSEGHRG